MPSFDVVSEVNMHELSNAIDQTNREVSTRFDFKGSNSRVEHKDAEITLIAPAEFQIHHPYFSMRCSSSHCLISTSDGITGG